MQSPPRNPLKLPLLIAAGVLALVAWSGLRFVQGFNPFQMGVRVASGPVVLNQIQALHRLETCRYNGEVIVEGKKRKWLPTWLAGDRILFVGRGEVVAGMDMGLLGADDVLVDGPRVTVRLPQPEILHTRLDNRGSQVFERQSGFLTGPDPNLETQVRVEAEDKIRQAALDNGVLREARQNAEAALRKQLQLLGFRDIHFI